MRLVPLRSWTFLLLLAAGGETTAQCQIQGGACNAALAGIYCGTAPRVGLNWLVCARPACPPSRNALFLGACAVPRLPIPAPPACSNCATCFLDVFPILHAQNWPGTGCFDFPIPRDSRLIGLTFCIQNVCLFTQPCVCLSNGLLVRIQA
jgi:hypothetical protein